jgi:hypothetical protein
MISKRRLLSSVIPAKAGIQGSRRGLAHVALDSRFRGNDDWERGWAERIEYCVIARAPL